MWVSCLSGWRHFLIFTVQLKTKASLSLQGALKSWHQPFPSRHHFCLKSPCRELRSPISFFSWHFVCQRANQIGKCQEHRNAPFLTFFFFFFKEMKTVYFYRDLNTALFRLDLIKLFLGRMQLKLFVNEFLGADMWSCFKKEWEVCFVFLVKCSQGFCSLSKATCLHCTLQPPSGFSSQAWIFKFCTSNCKIARISPVCDQI